MKESEKLLDESPSDFITFTSRAEIIDLLFSYFETTWEEGRLDEIDFWWFYIGNFGNKYKANQDVMLI